MKRSYILKKCQIFVLKFAILVVHLNIVNSDGHPLTSDDASNRFSITKKNYNTSTTDRIPDNKVVRNNGNCGSKQDKKRLLMTDGENKIINHNSYVSDNSQNYGTAFNLKLNEGNRIRNYENQDLSSNISGINAVSSANDVVNLAADLPQCILGMAQIYLAWWVNEDGSLREKLADYNAFAGNVLDLSLEERTETSLLEHVLRLKTTNRTDNVVFMSVAYNGLNTIPRTTLILVESTLQYLSLSGNPFTTSSFPNAPEIVNDIFVGWATFPELFQLIELDLRNCSIQYLDEKAFANVPNLKKLYLSHNNFIQIPSDIFAHLQWLVHLDLSYQNTVFLTPNKYVPRDPYTLITEGLLLPEDLFYRLENLRFLDLSHTKLLASSVKAFTMLGSNVEQLSLCYTNLPIIGRKMFSMTNLEVLDISGNPGLTPLIRRDSFEGLEEKLEILAYSHSNLKNLDFIQELASLRVLQLNDNNINQLSNETFRKLEKLEIIDFSSNHIGNWYSPAFQHNSNLRVLNLRDNNINLLTADMMADFSIVDYLAIGSNNFICNCILREFIELAAKNTRFANCTKNVEATTEQPSVTQSAIPLNVMNQKAGIQSFIPSSVRDYTNPSEGGPRIYYFPIENHYDIVTRIFHRYQESVTKSNQKIKESSDKYGMYWNLILYSKQKPQLTSVNAVANFGTYTFSRSINHDSSVFCNDTYFSREHLFSTGNNSAEIRLNFTFRLLDYSENDYVCIHSENSTEHHFVELDYCSHDRMSISNFIERFQSNHIGLGTLLLVMAVFSFILLVYYHKWWDIRYIFLLVKNATILSQLNKEKEDMKNGSKLVGDIDGSFNYDVFVSYSEPNRQWILTEFLPNIENENNVNVCLHERDFQVGLSILENIMSCMDRSRCILLVISEGFIVSHWCQFEMHLAQHRLLETKREQMILVLLEDIPKGKRPKTLQYLMKTKTYIVWPTKKNPNAKFKEKSKSISFGDDPVSRSDCAEVKKSQNLLEEERKLFWRRLKKALINANWESDKLSF